MNEYNDKGQHHGYWKHYYPNRNIMRKGDFNMSKQIGYWERYWSNKVLNSKEFYL